MIGRLTFALALLATSPPPGELAPIHGTYAPKIDAANFVRSIDNRYLPYKPGTRIHFKGVRGSTPQTDDEVVLHRTRQILGVTCTTVRDTVSEHGRAVERTDDWYAQDRQRTVPAGSFKHVLVTSEFSPAEPQTERKYYAPGVGEIAERVVRGHHEEFKLVSVPH